MKAVRFRLEHEEVIEGIGDKDEALSVFESEGSLADANIV